MQTRIGCMLLLTQVAHSGIIPGVTAGMSDIAEPDRLHAAMHCHVRLFGKPVLNSVAVS